MARASLSRSSSNPTQSTSTDGSARFDVPPPSFGGTAELHPETDKVHFCLGDASTFAALVACAGITGSPGVLHYGMPIATDADAFLSSM